LSGKHFQLTRETKNLLGDNQEFFDSFRSLNKELGLGLLGNDPEAHTETNIQGDGSIEVTFVYPIDNNRNPSDGRIYLQDKFVFDGQEKQLKAFERNFDADENSLSPQWKEWLGKYRDGLSGGPNATDPKVQKFGLLAGLSFARPMNSELKSVLKTQIPYLLKTQEAAQANFPDFQLKIGDPQCHYTLVRKDDQILLTLAFPLDKDKDPANGRIFSLEKFTLDANTKEIKKYERLWRPAQEIQGELKNKFRSVADQLNEVSDPEKPSYQGPSKEEATAFLNAILPQVLKPYAKESEGRDPKDLLDQEAKDNELPPNFQSGFTKKRIRNESLNEARASAAQDALEVFAVYAEESLQKRVSHSHGYLSAIEQGLGMDTAIDEVKEKKLLQSILKKMSDAQKQGPQKNLKALLEGLNLNEEEKALRTILAGDEFFAQIDSLGQELNPEIRAKQFVTLAREDLMKEKEMGQSAVFIAQKFQGNAAARADAEALIDVASGGGTFGSKFEFFASRFTKEVGSPGMLLAMGAAPFLGVGFESGVIAAFSRGEKVGKIGLGVASLAGIVGEAGAFTTVHKLVAASHQDMGDAFQGWGSEVASASLLFGLMRFSHSASAQLAEQLGKSMTFAESSLSTEGFVVSPTGRISTTAMLPRLNLKGRILSETTTHLGGIFSMQAANFLSRSIGMQKDNQQSFGANFLDAALSYGNAMVGFSVANGLSGGKLQLGMAEVRWRAQDFKTRVQDVKAQTQEPRVIINEAKARKAPGDPTVAPAPEAARKKKKVQPPVKPAEPEIKERDFFTLDAAFASAGWTQKSQAEVLALVAEGFLREPQASPYLGDHFLYQEDILKIIPKLIFQLSRAGFTAAAQAHYFTATKGMGRSQGNLLFHSPELIAAFHENGLKADQIEQVVSLFRDDKIKIANYERQRAAEGRRIMFDLDGFDKAGFQKTIAALEMLKGSDWDVRQKTDFLLKTRLSKTSMKKLSEHFPVVKTWVENEGWNTPLAVKYLTAVALAEPRFDPGVLRLALASRGYLPKHQAELLSNLVQYRGHYGQLIDPKNLETFLDFFKIRSWSKEDTFELLNHLAKKCGDVTLSQIPSLLHLVQVLEMKQWQATEIKELISSVTEHSGVELGTTVAVLKNYVSWLESWRWNRPAILLFLKQVADKSEGEFSTALDLFSKLSYYAPPAEQGAIAKHFLSLMENCNAYNRAQVLRLFRDRGHLFKEIGQSNFMGHLELYTTIMEKWPRIAYSALNNLMDATASGLIPKDISPYRESILKFIEQSHGFNSVHYKVYLVEGERFHAQIDEYAQRILSEDFGISDAREIIKKYDRLAPVGQGISYRPNLRHDGYGSLSNGERFFLGLIQRISPFSGVSYANDAQMVELLRQVMQAGDLRTHIPNAWRGRVSSFEMSRGAMDLKPGEQLDPKGKIKTLLEGFRLRDGEKEPTQDDLAEAMVAYLASKRDPAMGERLRQILFKRAAGSEELRERLENITELNFTSLGVLEEIFTAPDNLPKFLKEAFEEVPRGQGLVTQMGGIETLLGGADGLVKQIKKLAQNNKIPVERRKEILANLLKVYKPDGIRLKILSRADIPQEIKNEIEAVMGEKPDLTPREIIEDLLQEPRQWIEAEKNKFQFQHQGNQKIGLRAVKGPAFGLHGYLSGVCVGPDIQLWKDPKFKLLAITDEAESQALGYIHVYEQVIDGKKYLTLPGINPSAEYLGAFNRKQAGELFQKLMEGVKEFAVAGDYQGVFIPTSSGIHSNRSYFQDAIEKAGYRRKTIPEVSWNSLPRPFPFSQVFVAWEKNPKDLN